MHDISVSDAKRWCAWLAMFTQTIQGTTRPNISGVYTELRVGVTLCFFDQVSLTWQTSICSLVDVLSAFPTINQLLAIDEQLANTEGWQILNGANILHSITSGDWYDQSWCFIDFLVSLPASPVPIPLFSPPLFPPPLGLVVRDERRRRRWRRWGA